MSYDIDLCDENGICTVPEAFVDGGTYAVGGTNQCSLNVTYNYAPHYYRLIDAKEGIRWLYGKTGAETLPKLREAIAALADDSEPNYWKPTEGNARRALARLASFAEANPKGVWSGD
jgi:hypothetical protein